MRSKIRSIDTGSVIVEHPVETLGLPSKFQAKAKVTMESDTVKLNGDVCWVSFSKKGPTHIFLPKGKFPQGVRIDGEEPCTVTIEQL